MTWTNYEPPAALATRLGLPAWVPVRTDRLGEIEQEGEVHLPEFLAELDHVCDRQPEWTDRLTPAIIIAASIASDDAMAASDPDEAERLARIGLAYRPEEAGLLARVAAAERARGATAASPAAPEVAPTDDGDEVETEEEPGEEGEPPVVVAPGTTPVDDDATPSRRRLAIILGVVVALAAAGAVAWWTLGSDDDTETATDTPTTVATTEAPATTASPTTEPTTSGAPTTTASPTTTAAPTTTGDGPATTAPTTPVIPDVTGLTVGDAIALLEDAGYTVSVAARKTDEAEPGVVIAVDPPVGSEAEPGDPVRLIVAQGPDCNDAPDTLDRARFTDVGGLSAEAQTAIDWAVTVGLVSTGSQFGPDDPMTRGAAVTVLWRYVCRPDTGATNPFTDVAPDAFYADAVTWAAGTGIVGGTSPTTFGPDAPVSRGAFLTMVWRALGSPPATGTTPFTDVDDAAFFAPAVRWAYGEGLVSGTTSTTFSPDATLDRITTIVLFDRLERGLDPPVS